MLFRTDQIRAKTSKLFFEKLFGTVFDWLDADWSKGKMFLFFSDFDGSTHSLSNDPGAFWQFDNLLIKTILIRF